MPFCLLPAIAEKFKALIREGKIDIEKLRNMTSEQRRDFFRKYLGEKNAFEVNALFESKLLLKNQQRGLVNWAKQITGMKPELKNTIIDKIMNMKEILTPATEAKFLQDLASKRLGTDITIKEATKITELSNKISELENYKTDAERIAYGRAKIDLQKYVNSLNPKRANIFTNVANLPRTFMASLDLSAPLNQGWGMLSRKQFYTSLKEMFKYVKSEDGLKNLQADILTRPIYKRAKKAGLRLTDLGEKLEMREEVFMSNLLDKVPGIAASQRAYTGFLNKLRIDVFEDLIKKAEQAGEDVNINSQATKDIASAVNDFTGGARVGKIEGAVPMLNATFFSPRKITSTLNMMNPWKYIDPKTSKTARLARTRNLVGSLAISATIIKLVEMLTGEKQEKDSRSTKFGKIRLGNNQIDVTGGNATYATLLSRILTGETKTQKGEVKELGNKFGQTSVTDLISQGIRYKLSPNASLIVDVLSGANAIGEEKTPTQAVKDRFKPMFLNSLYELMEDDSTGAFVTTLFAIGALFGGGLSTFEIKK